MHQGVRQTELPLRRVLTTLPITADSPPRFARGPQRIHATARAPERVLPRMRLAVVTETYPPELNGVALTVAHSVRYLRAQGHSVTVLRPRQPGEAKHRTANECLLPGIGLPLYQGVQFGLPVVLQLKRRWSADRPQLVHIATEGPLGWAALHVARRLGIPVTTDYRTQFHRYSVHYGVGLLAPAIEAYLRRFHNRADTTFVSTDCLRAELATRGYRNVVTVGRGIDTKLFNPARRDAGLRASWGVGPHDVAVLYVGRLAPEKNLDLAARAYEAVHRRCPRARMIWVGDGPARARLQRAYPQHLFCGAISGEALAAHYASADLFVFPSLTETFGNVTLEALASGLAVLAYDYGAAGQHATDGRDARLVPYGDVDAYLGAALELAASSDLRARLRAAAPHAAAPLAWPRVLAPFEAHLAARITACATRNAYAAD